MILKKSTSYDIHISFTYYYEAKLTILEQVKLSLDWNKFPDILQNSLTIS